MPSLQVSLVCVLSKINPQGNKQWFYNCCRAQIVFGYVGQLSQD